MPRLPTVPREALGDAEPLLQHFEKVMGFLPNSLLTLGHCPEILKASAELGCVILSPNRVPAELKLLIAHMVSQAAGCRYCIAHTGAFAVERGVNETKLKAIFEFETSSLFTAAERAALKVARGAGVIPNGVNDEEFRQLRTHFGDEQVVEMISVIAFYGFLNRWNDTIATELESTPTQFASEHLAAQGWKLGKHARENS